MNSNRLRLTVFGKQNGVFQYLRGVRTLGVEPWRVDGCAHSLKAIEECETSLIVDTGGNALDTAPACQASAGGSAPHPDLITNSSS